MGCDIHYVVEEYDEELGWIGIFATDSLFDISYVTRDAHPLWQFKDRNYEFFAKLAGVRGSGPKPKGLPSGISLMTKKAVREWDNAGHSHSYCSLYQFAYIYLKSSQYIGKVVEAKLTGIDPVMQLLGRSFLAKEDNIKEFRVCFWFDN
jgi:hypothetical protein